MDFRSLPLKEKQEFAKLMFEPLSSPQEVKDWVKLFLGLELPSGSIDPESTSSPLDCIWQIYNTFKHNSGDKSPGYILMSCREGMKTVSVSIMEILLLLHMQLDIGHAASIESQSTVALGYISGFILNISPLLEIAGWIPISENKRLIKYQTPDNKQPFIKIVICNPKGLNSLHSNVLFLDELDLADPQALKEGKFITGFSKGIYGVKVYLSTRKYAFGNMAKAIEEAASMNYKILRWNVLDVTERCPPSRHLPEGKKEDRYVQKNLPLVQMSPQEYSLLADAEKLKLELVKDTYEGCRKCTLLPICRMRLSKRPDSNVGGFYKPITAIKQAFTESDADSAEAQLMCWRPGSEGLVYPRFNSQQNVTSLEKAYQDLTGAHKTNVSELDLLYELQKLNIPIYAGVDWGFTHDTVIIIAAAIPNGEIWVLDCFAAPGLEFEDILDVAKSFRDKYIITKWFADQAMPSHIKSFNKNGMKSPKFTKDVLGGIESVRSKIVNAAGKRLFKIVQTPNTKKVMSAILKHRFKLDGQGMVTVQPDDERGIADICDALRYIGQNAFPIKGPRKVETTWTEGRIVEDNHVPTVNEQMKNEIATRIGDAEEFKSSPNVKTGIKWNI